MRKQGYYAEVVERWVPGANIRRDFAGFIDVLCIKGNEIVGVQATSGSNVAARVTKIAEHENVGLIRTAGIRILVHGWRKRAEKRGGRKVWHLREVDVS